MLSIETGHVEIDKLTAGLVHLADDGARHNVARRKFSSLMVARHKAFQHNVAQLRALTPQRFRKQEARRSLDKQRGGMKLHKFHVADEGAGAVGHGHAVATGHGGIGGFLVDVPQPARGEQYGAGASASRRGSFLVQVSDSQDGAILNQQFGCKGARIQLNRGERLRLGHQGPQNFTAGRISMGMQHPRAAVGALARKGQLRPVAVEAHSPIDQLVDLYGAFFNQNVDRLLAAEAIASL